MERVEELVLRVAPDVTAHPMPGGQVLLRRPSAGEYERLPETTWRALSRLDGRRPLREVAQDLLESGAGPGLRELLDAVQRLRRHGMLEPASPGARRRRGPLALVVRVPLAAQPGRSINVVTWWLLAAPALAAALATLALSPAHAGPGTFLLPAVLTLSLVWSAQSLLSTVVLSLAGIRPFGVGVAFSLGIPHLWIDARDVVAAGPGTRASLSLAYVLVAALAVLLTHQAGGVPAGVLTATTLALWWELRPFGRSSLAELARAVSGSEDVWHDARAYLRRHLLRRMVQGGVPAPGEAAWLGLALVYPLWIYGGLALLGAALHGGLIPALLSVLSSEGTERAEGAVVLGLMALAVLFALGGPLLALGTWLGNHLRERRSASVVPRSEQDPRHLIPTLSATPLFATLPEAAIQQMATQSTVRDFPKGALVVRQGEEGQEFFIIQSGRLAVLHEHESGRREQLTELTAPDAFGEMALLSEGRRRATVQALEKSRLLVLSREGFWAGIAASGLEPAQVSQWLQLAQRLRKSPLFQGMSSQDLGRLLRRARPRPLRAGEVLMREGEPGEHFYVVVRGALKVTSGDRALARLGPGEFAGEVALVSQKPRNATVTADEETLVLELGREDFFTALAADFSFGMRVSDAARSRAGGDA
ncbi:MAG: cyclic nucleotide-binding domain-containing protein [Myxococcota bacterium]